MVPAFYDAVTPVQSAKCVADCAAKGGCRYILLWSLDFYQVMAVLSSWCVMQSNLAKQLGKLVKVKYVEDITDASRVGEPAHACTVSPIQSLTTGPESCCQHIRCKPAGLMQCWMPEAC